MEEVKLNWKQDDMLEIVLKNQMTFSKLEKHYLELVLQVEKTENYINCHILHKQGKYYLVHFKELFALDGKETNLSENDIARRNTIGKLLSDWGLVTLKGEVDPVHHLKSNKDYFIQRKE